jgi:hypothetical protein
MAFYTGRSGSVSFGTTTSSAPSSSLARPTNIRPVAKIRDWSLDTTLELISTNSIDSAVNTFTPGIKGATGSATLIYYRLEGNESASLYQFTQLISKLVKGGAASPADRVFLDLNVGTTAAVSVDDIQFWAYITSVGVQVSTGELSLVPIQFTMDGDFVEVLS